MSTDARRRSLAVLAALPALTSVDALGLPDGGRGQVGGSPRFLVGLIPGRDGRAGTPGASAMQALLTLAEHPREPERMPFARVLLEALQRGNALVFPLARTAEREASWQWLAPVAPDLWVVWVHRAALSSAPTVAHLTALRIGVLRGSALATQLRGMGIQNLQESGYEYVSARMLKHARIDAWATAASVGAALLRSEGVDLNQLHPALPVGRLDLWLAATPDVLPSVVARWRGAMTVAAQLCATESPVVPRPLPTVRRTKA